MLQMVQIQLSALSVLLVAAQVLYITAVHRIAAVQVVALRQMLVLVVLVMLVATAPLKVTLVQPTVAVVKVPVVAALAV